MNENHENDEECCICLENLKDKDVAVLNCNHKIHFECIGKWMQSIKDNNIQTENEFCPLCCTGDHIINVIVNNKIKKNTNTNLSNKKLKKNKFFNFLSKLSFK